MNMMQYSAAIIWRNRNAKSVFPEIRQIDEQIAHISVEKAKALLLKQVSNAEAKKSLQDTIYDLSMEKVNLLAIHDYPADYLDPIYDCPECKDTGYIGDKKSAEDSPYSLQPV